MAKVLILKGALKGQIVDSKVVKGGYVVKNSDEDYGFFIPEDCALRTNGTSCKYQIKMFNLTTLRKNGFSFGCGELVYSKDGLSMSLSGRWLNKIDDVLDVVAETDDLIVVYQYDKYFFIPKALRGIMYKHI